MAAPPPSTGDNGTVTDERRRVSLSPVRRRGRSGRREQSVAGPARMVREVSGQFPLLTKTNYCDWSAMMRVMLRARGLWTAVKEGTTDEVEDQMAMEALLRGVPLGMASSLASKSSAKAA